MKRGDKFLEWYPPYYDKELKGVVFHWYDGKEFWYTKQETLEP